MNKLFLIIGLLLLIGGLVYALMPHDMHNSMSGQTGMATMDDHDMDHTSHGTHITYGLIAAIIGFASMIAGWKIFD